MSAAPADWHDRVATVERELHRRFGRTPQLRASDQQSERIGRLLESGQLTSRSSSSAAGSRGKGRHSDRSTETEAGTHGPFGRKDFKFFFPNGPG